MNKILRLSFIAVMALVCGTMSAQTELLENGGFYRRKYVFFISD